MNKLLLGALATIGLGAATAGIVVVAGVVDVGADTPHSSFTYQALTFARERAIASRTGEIQIPADLADPERVRRGAGNYAAMCVNCHLSPEAPDSEIRKGLYPTPPNLSEKPAAPSSRDAARDFWIIKHGIKASGMPAWSKGGMEDEAIWDLTAFLQKMPLLSATAYEQLVAASDGHSHGGLEGHEQGHGGHEEAPAAPVEEKPVAKGKNAHSHDHGAHKH
ncbi:cytochrome c [Azonexus hydrophilus]|uniref:Cytochrome c n=1 Tax=Azonexus hydrophilus TaxID=418702 RepID=A0ABZ2XHZ5_9RHOO